MGKILLKLQDAADKGLLNPEQVEPLAEFLSHTDNHTPKFDFTHLLYYLGGLVAIGAMSLFMTLGWEEFGGGGILVISLGYITVALGLTEHFSRQALPIPAGICACFMVCMVPLAVFGLQQLMGWWSDDSAYREYHRYIKPLWIYMELATLFAGVLLLRRYRYPFIMLPIAVTLWYLSMDIVELLNAGVIDSWDFEFRSRVSIVFGLIMILMAFWVDIRSKKGLDFSFWLYLFGVMTFWGGLTSQESDSELGKLVYCGINLFMMMTGVAIARRVFTVFGAIGVSIYLGHLANQVFQDSWLFPISLTLIGLGIIYIGILWQKNEQNWANQLRVFLPSAFVSLLDKRSGV